MEIRCVDWVNPADMKALYEDAGWWEGDDSSYLNDAVKGSCVFVGAFEAGKMIGMGRALSDGVSDAYIQDIVVLTSHRGQGIGKKIIKALVLNLKEKGVDWIGLVAVPGSQKFYKALGFKVLEGHVPLKYEE